MLWLAALPTPKEGISYRVSFVLTSRQRLCRFVDIFAGVCASSSFSPFSTAIGNRSPYSSARDYFLDSTARR